MVGKNLAKELELFNPDIIDKYKPDVNKISKSQYDFAFICVDTPVSEKSLCDTTEVLNAINENKELMADDGIFIIKSTILPGTTENLRQKTNQRIIFSPEYYGSTQHCNNFEFDFSILGGVKEDCYCVIQLLQEVYDARHHFKVTDSKTAEISKYMLNSWLATKVTFCSQFYEIAQKENRSYEELRELFIMDPRVNPSHTFIYNNHPYWDSHCLNKDVLAIAESQDAEFLKALIDYNNKKKIKF